MAVAEDCHSVTYLCKKRTTVALNLPDFAIFSVKCELVGLFTLVKAACERLRILFDLLAGMTSLHLLTSRTNGEAHNYEHG